METFSVIAAMQLWSRAKFVVSSKWGWAVLMVEYNHILGFWPGSVVFSGQHVASQGLCTLQKVL